MNTDDLIDHFNELVDSAQTIMRNKNADYANPETTGNPFANFTRSEAMGICSTEQGFLVRMTDKMSRLATFVARGDLKVEDESFDDTILDLMNYLVLLHAFRRYEGDL